MEFHHNSQFLTDACLSQKILKIIKAKIENRKEDISAGSQTTIKRSSNNQDRENFPPFLNSMAQFVEKSYCCGLLENLLEGALEAKNGYGIRFMSIPQMQQCLTVIINPVGMKGDVLDNSLWEQGLLILSWSQIQSIFQYAGHSKIRQLLKEKQEMDHFCRDISYLGNRSSSKSCFGGSPQGELSLVGSGPQNETNRVKSFSFRLQSAVQVCQSSGSVYLEDLQRIDIKHNKTILQFITKSFSEGFSSKSIKQLLGRIEITSQQIRNILAQRFSTIRLVVKKLVGASKLRALKLQDYKVFALIREQGGVFFDLTDIYDSCKQWMKLRAKKYIQQRTLIEERLICFHSKFKESAIEYVELDAKKMKTSQVDLFDNRMLVKKDILNNPKAMEDEQSEKDLASVFLPSIINWKKSDCTIPQIDEKEIQWENHKTMANMDVLGINSQRYSISAEQEPSFDNFLAEESHQNLFQGYLMYEDSSLLC